MNAMDQWIDRMTNKYPWFNSVLPVLTFLWVWTLTIAFFAKGIDIEPSNVSIIKIVYVTFALICTVLFQFSREIWQQMIFPFWSFILIYLVFILLLTSLFQVPAIKTLLESLKIDSKWQEDIGISVLGFWQFISFLFFKIIKIIMVVILQILLRKINTIHTIRPKIVEKMVEVLDTFFDITKLTVFGIIMSAVYKINLINFFIVLAAVFSMVLKRTFRYVIIQLISVCAAIIILCQLIMQLNTFSGSKNVTCESGNKTVVLNNDVWFGISKIEGESIFYNVIGYICIIALVTIYTVVIKEKNIIEGLKQDAGWDPHKMFADTTYRESDKDFSSFVKYLLKYGFYHYGIELTYICIVLLIQARLDILALIYSLWLMIFILCSNDVLITVWQIFKYFVVISIPLQYAVALGFWPEKCFEYEIQKNKILKDTFLWLNLPVGDSRFDAYKLFWDSLVFLFALCQANVFEFERKNKKDRLPEMSSESKLQFNPSFLKPKTTFGIIRYAVFCSLPFISAVAFFLAATFTITILSIGYAIGFSLILWFADNYFLRSSSHTLILWKYLLILSVTMIVIKTSLQIPACIFMDYLMKNSCWLVQLFGIACIRISVSTIAFLKVPIWNIAEKLENSCWYLPNKVGIEWDVLCFISLMFHKRFLQSNYFTAMAKEANLDAKFSYKAAKILVELNEKEIRNMREKYKKNLEKIQKNMVRLKKAQNRIRGIKITEPVTHQEAVTSGDYYMFHDADMDVKLSTEIDDETKPKEDPQTPSVGKFLEAVLKADIEQALKLSDGSSSVSEKSSKSSSKSSTKKKEICYKCECVSKEGMDLHKQLIEEKHKKEMEEEKKSMKLPQKRSPDSKSKKSVHPSPIVLKDNKLQPSIDFRHKKSIESSSVKKVQGHRDSKSNIKECDCDCEDCKCTKKFYNKLHYKFCLTIKFIKAFISSCMISLIQICNRLAYDYKQIKIQLEKEKNMEKHRLLLLLSTTNRQFSDFISTNVEKGENTYQIPIYIRLLMSIHDLIMCHFSTVCFFSVLLLQMNVASLICLPLTMLVLFWGSLSVPRPTKRFWKILFAYTVFILILECIFRSPIVRYTYEPFDSGPYKINELFGIEKYDNYSIYYLIVILAIILQRRLLINIGLWPIESSLQRRRNVLRTSVGAVNAFFRKLLYERYNRIPVDVYTHIFVCDFINIFVFIFGFASVTEKKEIGVTRYFSENKIPPALLITFVIQCLVIFIDRWIYLKKHVVAKLILQFVQIILIHFCLFVLLPIATLRRFNELFFPSLWYLIKIIYLLLSAYQIRSGYPTSVHGHALCQSYSVVNMYLYQFYLIFPFVYELRTITDWMWTETTLTLSEWLGMEDIFCTVFLLKCWRNYDNKYSYKRGQKITSQMKFILGGSIVLLFFLILFFPLTFFAFGRVAGKLNIPQKLELQFRIGSYQPIYTSFTDDIQSLNENQWMRFKAIYEYYPTDSAFLSEYYAEDVGVVRLSSYSNVAWSYSQIFYDNMISDIKMGEPIKIISEWKLYRKTENLKQSNMVTGIQQVFLSNESKNELSQVLQGSRFTFSVHNILPKFLKVSSSATTYPVDALKITYDDSQLLTYGNITFLITTDNTGRIWWQIRESIPRINIIQNVHAIVSKNNTDILIFTFNDKIFPPGIFSYFSAQGIIGLYTTFLISIGFIIRRLCKGRTNQVFLDYIPNVDSILKLILDIYFVREHKDGKLEEDLYAKLIFLFRSPETLIRWTRIPEDSD